MTPWIHMALTLLLLQDPDPLVPAPGAPQASPAEDLGPPRFDRDLSLDEIQQALARLAAEHAELSTLEVLGRSRLGHDLSALAMTDPDTGGPTEKPALLFIDHRGPGVGDGPTDGDVGANLRGAEAVLALGWSLATRADRDPAIAELLEEHVVYLVPAADPDARVPEGATMQPAIEFDRNFPLGWLPAAMRPGSGDFPLARPETRALAGFLREHPNLVLVVSVAPTDTGGFAGDEPWRGAEFPESDREALANLCEPFAGAAQILRPWGRLGSPGGGLFDYAYQALGIYPVAWVPAAGPLEVDAVVAGTIELLRRMPRMRIAQAGKREVAPGLWEVDVAISNTGILPTLSTLGARRRVADSLYLDVEGPRLVATARKSTRNLPYHEARLHAPGEAIDLEGSILLGGETRWLRLVLEGEAGTIVQLQGIGARAGTLRLELELR